MEISMALKFFAALFAIMNPFIGLPLFMSLTAGKTTQDTRKMANTTAIAVFIILILSLFAGKQLLKAMGITVGAFETAGGFVIFLIALSMINAEKTPTHNSEKEREEALKKTNPAIVPLAMPILGGPGSVATVIVYSHYLSGIEGHAFASGVIFIAVLFLWIVFLFAHKISDLIGIIGLGILTRIMGIVLASIAVEMMANGIKDLLPI